VGSHLHDLAWGRDPRAVVADQAEKSIGAEETFARDVDDPRVVLRELLRLSERVAARLRAADMIGRTVTIKVRFADFTTITRSRTMSEYTDVAQTIYGMARMLFEALGLDRARLRLVGVRLEGLIESGAGHHQLALDERPHGWRDAERAVDRAGARFGAGAVRPATLVTDRTGADPAAGGALGDPRKPSGSDRPEVPGRLLGGRPQDP
jgi:DNA polymerase-4